MSIIRWAKFQRFHVKAGDIIQHRKSKELYKIANGMQYCISSKPVTDTFYTLYKIENGETLQIGYTLTKLRIFEDYDIVKVGTLLYGM